MSDGPHFEEINVERINIVESDGTLRLTIANKARTPDPALAGTEHDRTGKRGAGLLFFDETGAEIGGLSYNGRRGQGGTSLTVDRYGQDQVVTVGYGERDGMYEAGVWIIDRPATPLAEQMDDYFRAAKIADEDERNAELARLSEGTANRVTLGRQADGSAGVIVFDSKGRQRIRLMVDADDEPRLEFLDADGNVTFSLPA